MISVETRRALEARCYPQLQQVVFDRFERTLVARLTGAGLPDGPRVLDSGSGPGSWILQDQRGLIPLLIGQDVYRPDTSQLDAFVLSRGEQLPFADESFDLITAYLVLEHLPEPERAFHEYARVLRPGGCFCFKTPAVRTPLFLLAKVMPTLMHRRLKSGIGTDPEDVHPTYYRANTVPRLERLLAEAGFRRDWLATVDQTYAYLPHTRFTYTMGLLYSRLTQCPPLAFLHNQIIGIYRMPGESA